MIKFLSSLFFCKLKAENHGAKITPSKRYRKGQDSSWLLSWTINRQGQFREQDRDKVCVWVYGLFTDVSGDYVKKPMRDCTGKEITEEWLYQFRIFRTVCRDAPRYRFHDGILGQNRDGSCLRTARCGQRRAGSMGKRVRYPRTVRQFR